MEKILEREIIAEAKRRLIKYERKIEYRTKYLERVAKRTGRPASSPPVPKPKIWSHSRQFDPAYCLSHSKFLARSIVASVRNDNYTTKKSYRFSFAKPSGDKRHVDVFGIPDTALASLLSEAIRERNTKIFSSNSFAYLPGKTALDAVSRLKQYVKADKVYVSKFDFQDYFGSIRSSFIEENVLNSESFLLTNFEKKVIKSYLKHEYLETDGTSGERTRGIPQGSSISLFLANAVGHFLDVELDQISGNYIRYADDSILINYKYEDSIEAIAAYRSFTDRTDVQVNQQKTTGIHILSKRTEEMRTIRDFDFLGYRFHSEGITIADTGISRIKKRCSQIIYDSLLLYPKKHGSLNCARLDGTRLDWDFVSCLHRLRSYINGPWSNTDIQEFLAGRKRIKVLSGCASYYCLADTAEEFAKMDGWLLWAIQRALNERRKLIYKHCGKPGWKLLTQDELLSGSWFDREKGDFDISMPSFVLAWRASKKCWSQHGALGVAIPGDSSGDQ